MRLYTFIITIILMVLVGCANNRIKDDEHNHDESLQLTAYNDKFEVFAEITPLVKDHSSEILAHFSFLKNFKPLESGKITVSLIIGEDGVRQNLDAPIKPGIYSFSLKPIATGSGRLVFDIEYSGGSSQIIIPDIKVYADEHEAQHEAAETAIENSNAVVFTKEKSWKINFETQKIEPIIFGDIIKTVGQIQGSQGDERIVSAKTNGLITFTNNLTEGQPVKSGQTLFYIESNGLADNNISVKYNEALSEYNRADAEYKRKQELANDKIVSASDLLMAKTEFNNAKIVFDNLKKNFSSGKQVISSPINGFINQIQVKNGEYVEAGQNLISVSQNKDLIIVAELQPKYFSVLNSISTANIRLSNNKVYSLDDLNGKLLSYKKNVSIDNPLIPVLFQVENNVNLLSGSFVELYIKTQTNNQAIAIANEAIVEEMGNYFVFVQLTPELFEKRAITKGKTDGFRTEVYEGLESGERIVNKGAIYVKLAQASGELDAHSGHVH